VIFLPSDCQCHILDRTTWLETTICLIDGIPTSYDSAEGLSHKSGISRMGEPVQAIRVINEKQLLLIVVGINIGKPGRENWDY
jgi:hypothetical protein